ncbi:GNAT family N-acetyltransferase [Algoriphagus sp.]|uniref:GNAT family N-acetyltransferase n=1 Tax=Algoriphagus sp. TaxID=1872435 RepID=UPI0025F87E45|nr:GNAT family N-acetyltransferase [Algoriphagus sp.]
MPHLLDNPIFHSLTGLDQKFNEGSFQFPFFNQDIAPFMSLEKWDKDSQKSLLSNTPKDRLWYLLINQEVDFIPELEVTLAGPATQLISTNRVLEPATKIKTEITPLTLSNVDEMIALTELTEPGPFSKRTIEFGNYHGVIINGKLAAMGGERMHIGDYTEVSAICTHPDFRGAGLGAKITHFLTESIYSQGRKPFLHSRADNAHAIAIYKRLGYELRSPMHFYSFQQKDS